MLCYKKPQNAANDTLDLTFSGHKPGTQARIMALTLELTELQSVLWINNYPNDWNKN